MLTAKARGYRCAVTLEYRLFERPERDLLASFLAESPWPFHSGGTPDRAQVAGRVNDGYYDGGSVRTFWIIADELRVGMVRLEDLDDDTPMFDLRLHEEARGRGVGTEAVRWLTAYLFTEFEHVFRVEATTRQDNVAMRRVLVRCGYVREAHYRSAWPGTDGSVNDALGYAILRSDWASGTITPVPWDVDPIVPPAASG